MGSACARMRCARKSWGRSISTRKFPSKPSSPSPKSCATSTPPTARHRRNRPIHEHAMTKDQIIAEISDMQGQIQAAREELSHGPEIDLVDISGRIETTVTAIAALDHEEALEVRPKPEERRLGKEGCRQVRSRWAASHK